VKLRELNAQFLKCESQSCYRVVETLAEADGLMHLCPVCFKRNGGPVGTESMIHWFRGKVPDDAYPGPGRWTPRGTGIDDLTFVPGTPEMPTSVLLQGHAHFRIVNGEIIDA
jgi:hypothetical protein